MALTYSPELELGNSLKHFILTDIFGNSFNSEKLKNSPAQVYAFICGHCPYVLAIEDRLIQLAQDLKKEQIPFVGICSNDSSEYPEDSPLALKKRAETKGYDFPYLIDHSQTVAKSFGAVCTPDFFIFDKNQNLAYRGRMDDSWKNPKAVSKRELFEAATLIAANKKINFESTPTMGCSIKWKDQ